MVKRRVTVNEPYQSDYTYTLTEPMGQHFASDFKPELTPKEMLSLGIFGGNYFTEVPDEFPQDWFDDVRFSATGHSDPKLNLFGVNASQPLSVWQKNGWIYFEDPKGWFLWYCRYYCGRRIPEEDRRQIARWRAIRRHVSQLQNSCAPGDLGCQPKRRQALLHWAYDSRIL
jgi:hypothetical protein